MHPTHSHRTRFRGQEKTISLVLVLILDVLFFFHEPSFGYEVSTVLKGGHISGRVHLASGLPQPRRYNLVVSPDPYYCGRISDGRGWRLSPSIQIGPHRGIPNVIVYLEGIDSGKPFDHSAKPIKAINCQFSPVINVVREGHALILENWDPVPHKIEIFQATDKGGRLLESQDLKRNPQIRKSDFLMTGKIGEHRPGKPFIYQVGKEGRLVFRCSYHEYMEAWSLVLTHPYFSMTSDTGQYAITDIPAGTFKLVIWHPMGQVEKTIHVRAQQSLTMDLELPFLSPSTYQEDVGKPNPYGIDLTGDRHIVPTVELQQWPTEAKD